MKLAVLSTVKVITEVVAVAVRGVTDKHRSEAPLKERVGGSN